jgi:hypothetical protein
MRLDTGVKEKLHRMRAQDSAARTLRLSIVGRYSVCYSRRWEIRLAQSISRSVSFDLTAERTASVPWFVWSGILAVSSIAFGLYWDISWHETIGRDTFWTPAHLAIHFGGILAAFTCAYLIFSTTFSHDPAVKSAGVRVWGFRGPVGAFLTAWGGVTMVTSAPFDNWWHNSFGLDVEILSPPHVILGLGILGVGTGVLLLLVSVMNRAEGESKPKLNLLFLYLCGVLMFLHLILVSEYGDPTMMHSAIFYRVAALGTPTMLVAYARASGRRYGATIIASIYMLLTAAGLWILPLFPAHPRLGPVYTNVTHMVPMAFPILLAPAAFGLDLVLNRFSKRSRWLQAALAATAYLALLVIVSWPWGSFMMTPAARNWFFGQNYFPYQVPPSEYHFAWQFQLYETTRAQFALGFVYAWIAGVASVFVGIVFGDWLSRLRR